MLRRPPVAGGLSTSAVGRRRRVIVLWFIRITDGKAHDSHILDGILIEHGAFYVMGRGHDFKRPAHPSLQSCRRKRKAEAMARSRLFDRDFD
jgi:hypothetical protein